MALLKRAGRIQRKTVQLRSKPLPGFSLAKMGYKLNSSKDSSFLPDI